MTFLIPYKAKIAPIQEQAKYDWQQGMLGVLGGAVSQLPWGTYQQSPQQAQNAKYTATQQQAINQQIMMDAKINAEIEAKNAEYQQKEKAARAFANGITAKLTEAEKAFLLDAIKGEKW